MNRRTTVQRRGAGFILRLFLPFALGFFLSMLYRTVNSVLAPDLIAEFRLTATDLGLMTSSYFIAFAAAQYPLGVALDRFGARRTLSFLLLFASLGALTFAWARTVGWLMLGRGLIGLGVSGCLMSAFKAYHEHLPPERLPFVNGLQTLAGALGVMVATKPVYLMFTRLGLRGVFTMLAVATVVSSGLVFFTAPHREYEGDATESLSRQLRGALQIASTAKFWRLAPAASVTHASFLAINSLWIGPWLSDVAGLAPQRTASCLLLISFGMAVGCIGNGIVASILRPRGITTAGVALMGMVLFTLALGLIAAMQAAGGTTVSIALWAVFAVLGAFSYLCYPVFIAMFAGSFAGRVITLYNFLVFVLSALLQWGIGVIVSQWPLVDKNYNPGGYRAALLLVFFLNVATLMWLLLFKTGKLRFLGQEEFPPESSVRQP